MTIDVRETARLLQEHDRILVLTHKSPDGDTLGCACALCRALTAMGKTIRLENSDPIPAKFDYLLKTLPQPDFEPDYIVAVDIADTNLLGEKLSIYADKVDLCIDHHQSNHFYAKATLLEATAGAAAIPVYRVLNELGAEITPEIATDLYTGLSTDTGCFRYSNSDAEAYRIGADLIDAGADSADINVRMFETKPLAYFKLVSLVLANMRMFCDDHVCVFKITRDMLDEAGAKDEDCEPFAALSRQIEGVKCGISMREKADGNYKFSLRTHAPLDASKIAATLGGGGHQRAAGCDAKGDEEESLQLLIKTAADMLGCGIE